MANSDPKLEMISWDDAWKHVRAILPDAVYMTPGSLLAAAEKAGRPITVTHHAHPPASSDDLTALRESLTVCNSDEHVIAITDHSFGSGGSPFLFRASDANAFADAYLKTMGESILSGSDVVFICSKSRLLLLVDHEGHVSIVR
jgi:hypothetical protein